MAPTCPTPPPPADRGGARSGGWAANLSERNRVGSDARPAEIPGMPYLKRANGDPSGQCIELKGDQLVLGRLPECDVVLGFQGVSKRHARIYRSDAQYYLEDLRSLNGTKVNDVGVQPGKDRPLRQGDRINICDVEFIYYIRLPKTGDGGFDPGVLVTDDDGVTGTIHTFDASSVHLSSIKPE